MAILMSPTVMQTPCGNFRRQWAVLDHTHKGHGPAEGADTEFWALFPPILNEKMNQEIDQLRTVADVNEWQELVVKYNWSCPEHTLVDGVVVDGWGLVECVVDLRKMTQRNTRSGTVRAVKYFYVPM